MDRPKVIEFNCSTQETIERDMTDEELAKHEEMKAATELEIQQRQEQLAARESAKQSASEKLASLGLTESEISALLGR